MIYAKDHFALPPARPANATAMIGAQELHGEILDPSTGNVWQSLEPITREDYEALPLQPGWLRVELAEDWGLQLPTPTTVFFFPNGDSYQGPLAVSRASDAREPNSIDS